MNKKFSHIKHLFFDLDHTIWDFDTNARMTLLEMYDSYQLGALGIENPELFIAHYQKINYQLWQQYHLGQITKEILRAERFTQTFNQMGVSKEAIPKEFDAEFVRLGPLKSQLFEGAIEVLTYLSKKYPLYIISNGFSSSTHQKMKGSQLCPYFKRIFVSEEIGYHKPHPKVFEHILAESNAKASESVMIGDSIEADMMGALNAGMATIFFNTREELKPKEVTIEIQHLKTLLQLF